jgi:hypothetical protein
MKRWDVPTLPRYYVIDRTGTIRAAGVRNAAVLAALERALEKGRGHGGD